MKIKFNYIYLLLSLVLILSCREEPDYTVQDPAKARVGSYAELFQVFWDTMNNNYNYFPLEKKRTGLNWDNVYNEYYPKFQELKSFSNFSNAFTNEQRMKDINMASYYFYKILSNMSDQHFALSVTFPGPNNLNKTSRLFRMGKTTIEYTKNGIKTDFHNENITFNPNIIDSNNYFNNITTPNSRNIYGRDVLKEGKLKPKFANDVYYFRWKQFIVSSLVLRENSFSKTNFMAPEKLNASSYNFDDGNFEYIKNLKSAFQNNFNKANLELKEIMDSNEMKAFYAAINSFKEHEDLKKMHDALANLETLYNKKTTTFKSLKGAASIMLTIASQKQEKQLGNDKKRILKLKDVTRQIRENVNFDINEYQISSGFYYLASFFGFPIQKETIAELKDETTGLLPFYRLLNNIKNGNIKKVIFDLRGNGGGAVSDKDLFISRFITKPATYMHQRTKLGNGRTNYTPWVPEKIIPNKFAAKDVAVAVLIDKSSASMSEITSAIFKTQPKAKIIGTHSAGATAGLGPNEGFNGGFIGNASNYMNFYMPLMASKGPDDKYLETIGVTPDIKIPVTKEMADQFSRSYKNPSYEDPYIKAAAKYLNSVN